MNLVGTVATSSITDATPCACVCLCGGSATGRIHDSSPQNLHELVQAMLRSGREVPFSPPPSHHDHHYDHHHHHHFKFTLPFPTPSPSLISPMCAHLLWTERPPAWASNLASCRMEMSPDLRCPHGYQTLREMGDYRRRNTGDRHML